MGKSSIVNGYKDMNFLKFVFMNNIRQIWHVYLVIIINY